MSTTQVGHVLDNPVWYALNSYHAHFASGTKLVKRYPPEINMAVALANHSDAAIRDLEKMIEHAESIILFEANPPQNLPGWVVQRALKGVQLVCDQRSPQPESNLQIVELNKSNVPEMLNLIELTHPGPFASRTIEMGRFIGIRQQGQLVTMAGERFRLTGYCEISAVCTHPAWQGRGYGRFLTSVLVNGIWDRGETPFLHVLPENTVAYHLYESMGFHRRCNMTANVMLRI